MSPSPVHAFISLTSQRQEGDGGAWSVQIPWGSEAAILIPPIVSLS